jgi:uncharacterized protein YgbK (DUF1537 family)
LKEGNIIAVIADDFTGAAEIGGIGLRRGLKVLIVTAVNAVEDVDLLVIAAETRSMPVELAKKEIEKVTRQLLELKPKYIFKKLDSVLRGNVYEELKSQQIASAKKRVVMVPANPHFERTIKNGVYYIGGVPLAETFFANDPEFPVKHSTVADIVGNGASDVTVKNVNEKLPDSGIIIGNVVTVEDLGLWAHKADGQTVLAGGSGFFDAVLQKDFPLKTAGEKLAFVPGNHTLFILGSTFPKDKMSMDKFNEAGIEVINLNKEIFQEHGSPSKSLTALAVKIVSAIRQNRKVAVTTICDDDGTNISAETTRVNVGRVVKKVFGQLEIDDLFIEGGATASIILRNLGISQLVPFRELGFGIIQMHTEIYPGLKVTTKPGSYQWPDILIKKQQPIINKLT